MRMRAAASAWRHRAVVLSLVLAGALCGCSRTAVTVHSALLRLRVGEYQISPESVRIDAGCGHTGPRSAAGAAAASTR
jgi:hypothetical protein